jgi:hypothetical protein
MVDVRAGRLIALAILALGGCGPPAPTAERRALGIIEPGLWTQRALYAFVPPRRFASTLTWDAAHQQLVLFGGIDGTSFYGDTWTASATSDVWSITCYPPCTPPSARAGHAAAYDVARGKVVLYGGGGSSYDSDTWEWDGTTWTQRCSGCAPGTRAYAAMAWDPVRGHVILFGGVGGLAGNAPVGDTWQWDGTSWTALTPASSPPARYAAALALDSVRDRVLLFGGKDASNSTVNDTWEWDGASWTQLCTSAACTATLPPPRWSAGLAFDPNRRRAVLFGGSLTDGTTWEWNGAAWSAGATRGPIPRNSPAMAWFPPDSQILMFGGGSNFFGFDDTWEYHARGGPCLTSADCDGLSCVDGVCCEQSTCATCQSCDAAASAGVCAPVTNADDPDTCAGPKTCDASGACKLQIGQPCAATGDCASGFCVGGVCCNRACDKSCETCAPTGSVGSCVTAPAGSATAACGAFLCNGTSADCPTACNRDALCASGSWCNPTNGTCSTLKPGAQPCRTDDECQTKHCVDGVCCDSACNGRCQYCGSGTCLVPAGQDPRGDCAGDPSCGGTCQADGSCLFPGAEKACDVCKVCNQSGRCNQPPRSSDDAACGASIACGALSTECRMFADLTSHRCVDVGLCATPNDPASCTQFSDALDGTACAGGVCRRGACVASTTPTGKPPSGGGCSFAGRSAPGAAWLLVLLFTFTFRLRRRA